MPTPNKSSSKEVVFVEMQAAANVRNTNSIKKKIPTVVEHLQLSGCCWLKLHCDTFCSCSASVYLYFLSSHNYNTEL